MSNEKIDAFGEVTGWRTDLEEFMQHVFAAKGHSYWCTDWDVKYLNIRIDTRDNAYTLMADGRGDASNMKNKFHITPRKVLDAMDAWFSEWETEKRALTYADTIAQQAARIEELEAALTEIEILNYREGKTDSWIRAHMCGIANQALAKQGDT